MIPFVTRGPYLSALEIRSLYIKRYINSPSLLFRDILHHPYITCYNHTSLLSSAKRRGNVFGRVCPCMYSVCVCVSVSNALKFESLDTESLFLVRRYIFRFSRSSSYIKVIGSRSRIQEQQKRVCVLETAISYLQNKYNTFRQCET